LQLLEFAFDHLPLTTTDRSVRCLINNVVKDSLRPQDDCRKSAGRDAAFELFVGAVAAAAKLDPVLFEEPDLSCELKGQKYAIAAKRIKSVKSLLKRVSDGCEQIQRAGSYGFVALDTCLAFNPKNDRIEDPMATNQFLQRYFRVLNSVWRRYDARAQEIMLKHDRVLGLVIHDCQIRLNQQNEYELVGMSMRVVSASLTRPEQRHFSELTTIYTNGLPNQEDVSHPKLWVP
jgi:hypothetical protein